MRLRSTVPIAPGLMVAILSSGSFASSELSIYRSCGIEAAGTPTRGQLLCVAEAVGVPHDESKRIVRGGFDETFAEPTLEVLHAVYLPWPKGGGAVLLMELELSEVDGQVLQYHHSVRSLSEEEAKLMRDLGYRQAPFPGGYSPLAGMCGMSDAAKVDADRARCMAEALGMAPGLRGFRIAETNRDIGGPGWEVSNVLDESFCQDWGEYLQVSKADGRIATYGVLEGHCFDGPAPKRPILRPLREDRTSQ